MLLILDGFHCSKIYNHTIKHRKKKIMIPMKNKYYIPYYPSIDIRYSYLLLFYSIAEYSSSTCLFDTITYNNNNDLLTRLNSICTNT